MALETPLLEDAILAALEESSKITVDTDSSSDNSAKSEKARKKNCKSASKSY